MYDYILYGFDQYEIFKKGQRNEFIARTNSQTKAQQIVRGLNLLAEQEDEDHFTRILR